jgi:hypothetical protein
LDLRGKNWRETGEDCIMKSFITCSLHIYIYIYIRAINKRRMRWTGHAARTEEIRNAYTFWSENLKGGDHMEDLGVHEKIILEWILGRYGARVWTGCIWLIIETDGGVL